MNYLNMSEEKLRELGAFHTAQEIEQQVKAWQMTFDLFKQHQKQLEQFFNLEADIVMLGAGTSEYVGNVLEAECAQDYHFRLRSVPSTEMICDPKRYLNLNQETLVISFARSGNSPESLGAVEAIEAVHPQAKHLFITCNKDGKLAQLNQTMNNSYCLCLPDMTNDQGFAMTSSFSSMTLAGYCFLNLTQFDGVETQIKSWLETSPKHLESLIQLAKHVNESYDFDRIVYLGSHSLKAFAQESQLKVLELTQGAITTLFDSFMGFRHGPKSFIKDKTLIVLYRHPHVHTQRYEDDLIDELVRQRKLNQVCVLSPQVSSQAVDYHYVVSNPLELKAVLLGLNYLVFAQSLALSASLRVGLLPDNPCPSGEVNRVVTGVTLHPLKGN